MSRSTLILLLSIVVDISKSFNLVDALHERDRDQSTKADAKEILRIYILAKTAQIDQIASMTDYGAQNLNSRLHKYLKYQKSCRSVIQ